MYGNYGSYGMYGTYGGGYGGTYGGAVKAWHQCGGTGFSGPSGCALGLVCDKSSDAYHHCVPDLSLPGIPEHGQCGGKLWQGTGTCVLGTECIERGPYYSQCIRLP